MAKNELFITIPSYFKCPISMEVMKSPVSLSTGITYDRSSIQAWLDGGHTTCPATMQPLSSPSFVPNLTLHRLIHLWSLSHHHPSSPSFPHLIQKLTSDKDLNLSLKKILDKAKKSDENRRILARSDDLINSIVELVRKFDPVRDKIENLELVFQILDSVSSEIKNMREKLIDSNCLPKFVIVLRNARSTESKISTARVLEKIAIDAETKRLMIETPNLLNELYKLIFSESDDVIEIGLSSIITIAKSKSTKLELIRRGIVKRTVEILCDAGARDTVVQKAMEMVEMVCTCHEGRVVVCDDERCVAEIVRRLMKVNEKATQHGATVVWSVCYLFPNEKAREVVGKCLLLLQSNCGGVVKQMCRDLVKVLRVKSRDCLASYETKTTHIMPY